MSVRIGPYEVLEEVARGGMGVLYRARDPALMREVAVKLILSEASLPDTARRFRTEAVAASRVRHPNVVAVHGLGSDQGRPYLVMDLVEGQPLSQLVRNRGALRSREAAHLAARLARALEAVHARGVVHRDVKPENVLVGGDGEPVLVDFGLARLVDARTRATLTGELMGTPRTMAPEQADGDRARIGPWSDVYSLGVTLWELLAGQPLFRGASPLAVLAAVLGGRPRELASVAPAVDPHLAAICQSCLAREPAERPTAGALAGSLEGWLQAHDGPALRLAGWVVPCLALVGVLLVGLAALLVPALQDARGARDQARADLASARAELARLGSSVAAARIPVIAEDLGRAFAARPGPAPDPEATLRAILLVERARQEQLAGRMAESRDTLDEALRLAPDLFPARLLRAGTRRALGDLVGALEDAEAVVRVRPGHAEALLIRGNVHHDRGAMALAVADYEDAVRFAPTEGFRAQCLGQLAWGVLARGELERAREVATQSIELEPGVQALMVRAVVWRVDGRWEEAEQDLERAFQLQPEMPSLWAARSLLRLERGDAKRALADAERAVELAPTRQEPRCARALALLAGVDDPEVARRALADLDRAIASDPGYTRAHYGRGLARLRLGRREEGLADLRRAKELCPIWDTRLRGLIDQALDR